MSALVVQWGGRTECFASAFTIGRDATTAPLPEGLAPADLIVADDYASTRHARCTEDGGTWYVEDLGSTNGTRLNEARVYGPARLGKGDKVRVGHTILTVVPL